MIAVACLYSAPAFAGARIPSLAIGLLLAPALAQGPDRYQRTSWFTRLQQADGSWPAVGGKAEATLRVTALTLLANVGEGPAIQRYSGKPRQERESILLGIRWLRQQQDQKGRLGWRADPDWLLDHAIATYALAEALRITPLPEAAPDLCKAVDALRRACASAPPCAVIELRLWGGMIARSLRAVADAEKAAKVAPPGSGAYGAAKALAAGLEALPVAVAVTPRERAADNLRVILAGGEGEPHAAEWLADPLRDPMTAFYASVTAWLRGGSQWHEASKSIKDGVGQRQVRDGEQQGSWEPAGDFGAANGRTGTTAVAVLLLQVYYRYSHLELCSGN